MTDKKTKTEQTSPLRTPKPKNKLGLKVPSIPMPHEDIIRADEKPELTIVKPIESNAKELATIPSQSSLTSQSSATRQSQQSEIAPTKNYQKVANSISKQAIPEGWFKGKSKQLYDALYSLTRGAIVPLRKVRVQKGKLMKLAGIGSRITFDSNIQHLITVGLISEKVLAGEHEGNEFEVFIPEEISLTSRTTLTSQSSHAQKLDRLVSLESSQTSHSFESINTDISNEAKTLFKTLKYIDDDTPIIELLEKLNGMARKLTGKDLSVKEWKKFLDTAEILINETVIAAARTGAISSPMAFMYENLRRRLYSKPRMSKKSSDMPGGNEARWQDVGKSSESDESAWESLPSLDQEQRERILQTLKEDKEANGRFFRDFKTFGEIEYTPEDFKWLMDNLEK